MAIAMNTMTFYTTKDPKRTWILWAWSSQNYGWMFMVTVLLMQATLCKLPVLWIHEYHDFVMLIRMYHRLLFAQMVPQLRWNTPHSHLLSTPWLFMSTCINHCLLKKNFFDNPWGSLTIFPLNKQNQQDRPLVPVAST